LIGAANRQRIAIESIETSEWHIAPSFDPGRFGDAALNNRPHIATVYGRDGAADLSVIAHSSLL
jgi:hypothetical protein